MGSTITAQEVMGLYRTGEGDWDWPTEFSWIIADHGNDFADLLRDVALVGVREPILLGDDGRVWDGHHRILAALITGQPLFAEYGRTPSQLERPDGVRP